MLTVVLMKYPMKSPWNQHFSSDPEEAARIRAEALALEEEQKQQRREQRSLGVTKHPSGAGDVCVDRMGNLVNQ
jgi:hypothetical protein